MKQGLNLFTQQHPLVKILVSLILIALTFAATYMQLLFLFLIFAGYLLISPSLFLIWFRLLLNTLPLYIVILLFSIISKQDFYSVLLLIGRLIFLLLISAYLFKSTPLALQKNLLPATSAFNIFLLATLFFIPLFFKSFEKARQKYTSFYKILNYSLSETHDQIENIRRQIYEQEDIKFSFSYAADLPALVLLVLSGSIFCWLR